MDGWMDGWSEWMGGRTDGWMMDDGMDEFLYSTPCI